MMHSAWEGSEPWDDDPGYECWDCADKEKEMDCVREDLQDLIKVLYRGGELDLDGVDRAMEQLCYRTGIVCPKQELVQLYGHKELSA